jgi:hypothetical protein
MIVKGAIIRHSKILPHRPLHAEEALTVARIQQHLDKS